MTEQELVKKSLLQGYALEVGKLTICCINNYYKNFGDEVKFQVHCDHWKVLDKEGNPFSEIYEKIDDAVDKFILLKHKLYEI